MSTDVISKKNNGIRSNLKWSRYSELVSKKRELDNPRQQEEKQEERQYLDIYRKLIMIFMMD
jgi:hypothetical protein